MRSLWKLRIKSSAPTRSSRESATWPTTKARRNPKRCRLAVAVRPLARIASAGDRTVDRNAGTRPNSKQVPAVRAAVKVNTRQSQARERKVGQLFYQKKKT